MTTELTSRDEADAVLLKLLKAEIELSKQTGELDLARALAAKPFESPIRKAKENIGDLTGRLEAWYLANVDEFEAGDRRSIQLSHGILGRRKGNPTLAPLSEAWTWPAIGAKLKEFYKGKYFKPPAAPKIDTTKVRTGLSKEELEAVGLKVEQEDRFYCEPDHRVTV